MYINKVKEKLKKGLPVLGLSMSDEACTDFVELAGILGFDYIMFDTEHTTMTAAQLKPLFIAAERRSIVPMVTVNHNDPKEILQYLEAGAMGIMFPDVRSPEELKKLVGAVKYWPKGYRGMRSLRTADWALTAPRDEVRKMSNDNVMCIVMIESKQALDQIDEMLSIEGVDAAYLGPNDYSQTIGIPGQSKSTQVQGAIDTVISTGKKYGVAYSLGPNSPNFEDFERTWQRGGTMMSIGVQGMFTSMAKEYMKGYRELCEKIEKTNLQEIK